MARGHGECKFENASFSFANSIILNASGYVVVRSRDFSPLSDEATAGTSLPFFFFLFCSRRERGGHGWSWSRGIRRVSFHSSENSGAEAVNNNSWKGSDLYKFSFSQFRQVEVMSRKLWWFFFWFWIMSYDFSYDGRDDPCISKLYDSFWMYIYMSMKIDSPKIEFNCHWIMLN